MEVDYQFEVIDPISYTETWKGQMPMRSSREPIYEYACHEGNHALPGILGGARVIEAAEAADAAKKASATKPAKAKN